MELVPKAVNHRYKQLDSLRGLAALAVFLGHFLSVKTNVPFFNAVQPTPLGVLFNGNAAVMFFFLLSGFVLSLPFVNDERPLKLTPFYLKRIFRLYPAFIFAIGLSLVLKQFVFDKSAIAAFPDWIRNDWNWDFNKDSIKQVIKTLWLIGPPFKTTLIDAPIWSLVIEMKMSIILPFFIVIVSRGNLAFNMLFLLGMVHLSYQHDSWAIGIFYLGVLMAKYKDPILLYLRQCSMWKLWAAIVLAIFLYNNYFEFLSQYQHLNLFYKVIWINYLVAIGSSLLVMLVLAGRRVSRFLQHSLFIFLGDISYSFYLVHLPLLLTVSSLFAARFSFSMLYIFLSTLILSVIISYLMFIFIEKPFQRIAVKLIRRYKILNTITL